MTEQELSAMTVMQLRKLAKDQKIILGAGIDKAGIIQKLLSGENPEEPSVPVTSEESEPKFQAAWHNASDAPRFSARPAYQAPGAAPRPAWLNTTPSGNPVQRK